MSNLKEVARQLLERGKTVELDEFGLDSAKKVDDSCRACESRYRRTIAGWDICYECDEPWESEH